MGLLWEKDQWEERERREREREKRKKGLTYWLKNLSKNYILTPKLLKFIKSHHKILFIAISSKIKFWALHYDISNLGFWGSNHQVIHDDFESVRAGRRKQCPLTWFELWLFRKGDCAEVIQMVWTDAYFNESVEDMLSALSRCAERLGV